MIPYAFLYIVIILSLIEKFIVIYTQLIKKNVDAKFNIVTCRIVLPEINLWFYYYQL